MSGFEFAGKKNLWTFQRQPVIWFVCVLTFLHKKGHLCSTKTKNFQGAKNNFLRKDWVSWWENYKLIAGHGEGQVVHNSWTEIWWELDVSFMTMRDKWRFEQDWVPLVAAWLNANIVKHKWFMFCGNDLMCEWDVCYLCVPFTPEAGIRSWKWHHMRVDNVSFVSRAKQDGCICCCH